MPGPDQPATRNVSPFAQLLMRAERRGCSDSHLGNRRHPRFAMGATLVATERVADLELAWPVVMKDISNGGMAVQSERPVPLGDTFYLNDTPAANAESWVCAQVMHCTQTDSGYLIGVSLVDDASL